MYNLSLTDSFPKSSTIANKEITDKKNCNRKI